jgi:hypothetical protein
MSAIGDDLAYLLIVVPQFVVIGAYAGMSLASLRRFWTVAAKWNSSRAPQGPRSRNLSSFRMRLRWANSISTFFADSARSGSSGLGDLARDVARAFADRVQHVAGRALGQQRGFSGHGPQSCLLARWRIKLSFDTPARGVVNRRR